MPREIRLYLHDIIDSINKIEKYIEKTTFSHFENNSLLQDGIIRNLEIIGEAVKSIPESIKRKFNGIRWKEIASFRDIAIHQYFSLDLEIIWDIVQNELEEVRDQISLIQKSLNYK